jgi:hypothetical protein
MLHKKRRAEPRKPAAPLNLARIGTTRGQDFRMPSGVHGRGILASATPDRDDRLFPGDPMQFIAGGLNLAHGAAGVLYALAATGCGSFPTHEDWLVDRALHLSSTPRFGLYDRLHGVAHVLDRLGRKTEALEVLDLCFRELDGSLDQLGLDLQGGLAGIGLNLGYFAAVTGERRLEEAAEGSWGSWRPVWATRTRSQQ